MRGLEPERLEALIEMLAALVAGCSATAALLCALALLARGVARHRTRRRGRAPIERYVVGRPDHDGAELYLLDGDGVRRLSRVHVPPGREHERQRLVAVSGRRRSTRPADRVLIDLRLPDDWRETGFSVPVTVDRHRLGRSRRRRR